MLYQLKPLFMGERDSLPIDCEMDFSGLEYQNARPFQSPVRVKGEVTASAGVVTLRVTISTQIHGNCDRCLAAFVHPMEVPVERILVSSLNNEENDEYLVLDNDQLPLDELAEEELVLNLPSKNLCRKDCRGLCPKCGRNLNEGLCGCRSDTADPRLEVLRQLMN
ncbi:MAG TPA: DUF177 domain-containing protein [Firmicutes bacterium]|nr:DUF177 domain-containing protein [Bacillota bacterium]